MSELLYYFDYAAATPVDAKVLTAMQPYFSEQFYNPSALYLHAKAARAAVETARQQVAASIGARPGEIYFTSGGTEANNLAIHGVMRQYPAANIVVSAIEHESVLEPARQYALKIAPVTSEGLVYAEKVAQLIDDQTVLVSIMYANNEVGSIQPISDIAQKVQAIRKARKASGNKTPLYLHTDACQAALYLLLQVNRLGVDMMTLNGGKIYGPKGSGALYAHASVALQSIVQGGGQENGWRSGTENVPGIVGFATALTAAQAHRGSESKRLQELQDQAFALIAKELPQITINGSIKKRLPNNIHITVPNIDNERLLMQLDEAGIMCATGSACSASNEGPSHVLLALGLTPDEARSSLRFTMGRNTTDEHIRYLIDHLKSCL